MTTNSLTILCWALWGMGLIAIVVGTIMMRTERRSSSHLGPKFGWILMGFLFVVLLIVGGLIVWAARNGSTYGLVTISVGLAYPWVVAVVRPIVRSLRNRRADREEARVGSFSDPDMTAMARVILANDPETLRKLLHGRTPPTSVDQAGLDLVGLAVLAITERSGGLEPLRILLEAGADPKHSRLPGGEPLLPLLIISRHRFPQVPQAVELLLKHGVSADEARPGSPDTALRLAGDQPDVVRLLVDHGADIERLDEYGQSPVVRFIGCRHWDSSLLLIEKGVRLDVVCTHGVSVDYYLNDWRSSVHGEHPEGWNRVRTAIAARRETAATKP